MSDQALAYPKRLIEVDLPIARISAHARREKSIRHGHISTLHIWWARRPLAACRAVICAALWPDPADELCPPKFRQDAFRILSDLRRRVLEGGLSPDQRAAVAPVTRISEPKDESDLLVLRRALLDFIAEFANWDLSINKFFLETSGALTQAAHESVGGEQGTRPLVFDPFAGGGSIPLEALRVGADAFASDLNPVAILLNQIVLEYLPKYGSRLAENVRKWGEWVKKEAERELTEFYPKDADGSTPIAYLWARTIRCEGPNCGVAVPILPSRLLEKNGNRSTWLNLEGKGSSVSITIERGHPGSDELKGTAKRGSVTCPCCGYTTPVSSIREQLKKGKGGIQDAQILAVATFTPSSRSRGYRLPSAADTNALRMASERLLELRQANPEAFPDDQLPLMSGVFNVPIYGHNTWSSLYSDRQLVLLATLVRLVQQAAETLRTQVDTEFAAAVATMLSIAVGKVADYSTTICTWVQSGGFVGHTFAQGQCLPMKFDFAETVPLAGFSGSWEGAIDWGCRIIEREASAIQRIGHAQRASATAQALPDDIASCLLTDPPYYNAVPYADLSDFFYVWHRRTLNQVHADLFGMELAPKSEEICEMAGWDPVRYEHKTAEFFESEIAKAFAESRRVLSPSGIGVIVFAHKSTSGWESLLQAIITSGWVVTASWPVDTERTSRLRAMQSAALGSSIHLVCRPRENLDGSLRTAEIGDWRDVLSELPERIHEWMPRLGNEGVVGADAIFACLGPALEIFSRYSRVEKSNGDVVPLREYLEHVWAAVSHEAITMIFKDADAAGLEPDARLTAMWLWTLASPSDSDEGKVSASNGDQDKSSEDEDDTKQVKVSGFVLEFDAARKIAQGLGIHLERIPSIVEVKGDKARLLPVAERTKYLFGKDAAEAPTAKKKPKKQAAQLTLFAALKEADAAESVERPELMAPQPGSTVLDRVHQAMILFAAGRGEALKRFLVEEGIGKDGRFWKLAQSLSALYPAGIDEKRWVDGVLARKKSLGL